MAKTSWQNTWKKQAGKIHGKNKLAKYMEKTSWQNTWKKQAGKTNYIYMAKTSWQNTGQEQYEEKW